MVSVILEDKKALLRRPYPCDLLRTIGVPKDAVNIIRQFCGHPSGLCAQRVWKRVFNQTQVFETFHDFDLEIFVLPEKAAGYKLLLLERREALQRLPPRDRPRYSERVLKSGS